MKFKDKKGSISIFVLVALLFMASVLLLMFASSINKSKVVKEQFNTISGIYAYDNVDAYNKAYTELREKNKANMTATNEGQEDTSVLELTETYADNVINLKIYGNTIDESSVGDSVTEESKLIPIRITGKNLFNKNLVDTTNGYIESAYLNADGITTITDERYNVSEYINIEASTTYFYTMSTLEENSSLRIAFYNENKEYISSANDLGKGKSFKTPENAKYLRIPIVKNEIDIAQLEEGITATKYESYKQPITLDIPLINSLTNTDYIELKKEGVYINGSLHEQYAEISLEYLRTFEDYTKIEVLTEVAPSKIEIEYVGYTLGKEETEEVQ